MWLVCYRYITSDCDSVQVMHMGHKFLNDTEEDAVAQVLQAGTALNPQTIYPFDIWFS